MDETLKTRQLPQEDAQIAADRKQDHIALAFASQVEAAKTDPRFYFEPLLSAHPTDWPVFPFLGKTMQAPIWVSSMTGGTQKAGTINKNLARVCGEFGLGMGLGSCRALLYSNDTLTDFAMRNLMGDQPFFANLGIAQLEELIEAGQVNRVNELIQKLEADGLIIHVNPLQEAMQPEGDHFKKPPLDTIRTILDRIKHPIIVKEVGQGFGPASLEALMRLPLAAIDFGASGGTNFAMLELLRSDEQRRTSYEPLARVGHTAAQMTDFAIKLYQNLGADALCRQLIVSGGITSFLDGYHCISRLPVPAVYGQAAPFLRHATGDYEILRSYTKQQINGLQLAKAFLTVAS
jgi:isopentenyl-diphosphate Delta-isomerase